MVSGCATPRKTSLFVDLQQDVPYTAAAIPDLVLQSGDRVTIQVMSPSPELAAPFRFSQSDSDNPGADSYTIDKDGQIEFPTLGTIKLKGLTLNGAERLITKKIVDIGYIKDPVVKVAIDNFKVTVIGHSGNAVLPVKDNSITLLEALASTGGIKENTNLNKVTVVRTVDGTRIAYNVDLQSKDLFDSPAYYLHQNDIVYLKQKGTKLSASGQMVLSIVTATLTLGNIFTNSLLWYYRR